MSDRFRFVKVVKNLPCKLTDAELKEFSRKLAVKCEDINAEESRQKDLKSEMKARLDGMESERTQLAICVRRQEEQRDVECDEAFDYELGKVTVTRNDTGEEIRVRAMTTEERQQSLPV
jgi:hypothetical protein